MTAETYKIKLRYGGKIVEKVGGPFAHEERRWAVSFPSNCVVCMAPAARYHAVCWDSTVFYGVGQEWRHAAARVPYCAEHARFLEAFEDEEDLSLPDPPYYRLVAAVPVLAVVAFVLALVAYVVVTIRYGVESPARGRALQAILTSAAAALVGTIVLGLYCRIRLRWWLKTPDAEPYLAAKKKVDEWSKKKAEVRAALRLSPKGRYVVFKFANGEFAEAFRAINEDLVIE